MTISKAYMFGVRFISRKTFFLCVTTAAVMLIGCCMPGHAFSQAEPVFDEVSVTLNVQQIGNTDITAIISNEVAYLPVNTIFEFIKIKNTLSAGIDSVSGYFINPSAYYVVDKVNDRIIFNDSIFAVRPADLIATETNLYLKADYFGKIFGLDCRFDFRSLSVTLTTKIELPAIREMRHNTMRNNFSRLINDEKADTVIARSKPLFHLGTADWSIVGRQQEGFTETRLNVAIGSIIAGCETNLSFNYNVNNRIDEKQQYYNWRYVNNGNPALRQVLAGKFFPQTISSLYYPVVGLNFTNTPTTIRRSFGTYRVSNITEPGWIVELYVNDVLMSYVKADASGFYTFDVPLIYGNTQVKLRFYGPYGEERTLESYVSIPFNFVPEHELEYSVSAGMVEDGIHSRFSRMNFNYGLNRFVSVGAGMEYLSSISAGKAIPFVNTAMRLAPNLLLSAEYAYGVRTRGILNYRLPSNLQAELNYTRYVKDQHAISFNFIEERNLVVSFPFRISNMIGYSRLTLNQKVLPSLKYTTGELLLSAMIYKMGINLTTYTQYTEPAHPFIYTNLSMLIRLPHLITFTPQAQYEFSQKKISMVKGQIEKQFFHNGYLNLSSERNFYYRSTNVSLGVRFDFSFMQAGFSSAVIDHKTSLLQSLSGSLLYDHSTNKVIANSRAGVGRGGITLIPFLDLNCNGLRDKGEPKASGLKVRMSNGYVQYNNYDTTVNLINLEPYVSYLISLDSNSFDNIAWKLRKKSLRVAVNPNMLTVIDIPVIITGEMSGYVYLNNKQAQKGLGRMIINIYRNDTVFVAQTLSEADGYFNFPMLEPGSYTARIDGRQLEKVHMTATPGALPVTIRCNKEGDVADGLKFILQIRPGEVTENEDDIQ